MTKHVHSITRRGLMAASLMAAAIAKSAVAQTPDPTPEAEASQYLLTAIAPWGDSSYWNGIETYDADLNKVGEIPIEDGVVHYNPTGKSGVVLITTMFGSQMADVGQGQAISINWESRDPGYIFPSLPEYGRELSDKYLMAMPMEMSAILLVDIETYEGRDISEYVANEGTEVITMVPDIPVEGSLGGVWTGDNVYMLDYENPESAEPLVGDDSDWYSTTLQLSYDGKWGIFTTYDPATNGEDARCYLQNLETGEYSHILDGNAWTTGFFIPNDLEHYIAHHPETGLEYRSIEAPDEAGKVLTEVEPQGGSRYWLNDGKTLLYGHRTNNDSPRDWLILDMESGESTELPDVTGMRPWWPQLAKSRLEHLLFITDSYADGPFDFVGLNTTTGETWSVLEDVNINTLNGITASQDARWYTISTLNRGSNIGVWLIDMANQNAYHMEEGDGLYAETGAVSPDGTTLAVTYLEQPDGIRYTMTASTESPEEMTKLTDAHVLGWVQ